MRVVQLLILHNILTNTKNISQDSKGNVTDSKYCLATANFTGLSWCITRMVGLEFDNGGHYVTPTERKGGFVQYICGGSHRNEKEKQIIVWRWTHKLRTPIDRPWLGVPQGRGLRVSRRKYVLCGGV